MMKGIFTISLDFELHWGGFEKWPLEMQQPSSIDYKTYFLNTRKAIPEMLRLFRHYEIHVTWATVGMLLCKSKQELIENMPLLKPTYDTQVLSAYHYIDTVGIGNDESEDPFHFASSLVKQILKTPHQELGTHTFSHYYCNEGGQTIYQFREDLKAVQRIAKANDITIRSLVFPRNQFNDAYLKVCFEEGITSVRSNPLDWFWKIESTQDESTWKRMNRGLDAYIPIGRKNTYSQNILKILKGFPVCIPASRLLRPYRPTEFFLNKFKINRIKAELTHAAKMKEVYHLWWHPHNFGHFPKQSLQALEEILMHYVHCRKKWGMQSLTMGELTDQVNHEE